jgi:hypothetical protein
MLAIVTYFAGALVPAAVGQDQAAPGCGCYRDPGQ